MKYFNKKIYFNDIKFDSKKELDYYNLLLSLEKQGLIKDIVLQPSFELIPSFKYNNQTIRKCVYTADFQYYDTKLNKIIIIEIKSAYTSKLTDYILRKKIFLYKNKDNEAIIFKEIIL